MGHRNRWNFGHHADGLLHAIKRTNNGFERNKKDFERFFFSDKTSLLTLN